MEFKRTLTFACSHVGTGRLIVDESFTSEEVEAMFEDMKDTICVVCRTKQHEDSKARI
jgi:translation initiation factor 2 beta subunit (eIF-2beta)/eIF-5